MKRIHLLTAALTFAGASLAPALTFVVDDFDGGSDARVTGATVSPDNSGNTGFNGAPGVFPGSNTDVFGRTNRGVLFDFADDSATGIGNPGEFPSDNFGIIPFASHPASNHFFGVQDLSNNDNPGGGGTASWTVDISGLTDLSLTTLFSAMGDFEAGDNSHEFSYSIDGSPNTTLFSIDGDNDGSFEYTMEGGAAVTINDPLVLTDDNGATIIDNTFTTQGVAAINGTGNTLTLNYMAGANNGGGEPFAFDDIILDASIIPEPSTSLLVLLGSAAFLIRRRK